MFNKAVKQKYERNTAVIIIFRGGFYIEIKGITRNNRYDDFIHMSKFYCLFKSLKVNYLLTNQIWIRNLKKTATVRYIDVKGILECKFLKIKYVVQ
jgi:hypothetical protein